MRIIFVILWLALGGWVAEGSLPREFIRWPGASGQFNYRYQLPGGAVSSAPMVRKIVLQGTRRVERDYDSSGRLEETRFLNNAGAALDRHHYQYNNLHQRERATFLEGNYVEYDYRDDGQLETAMGYEPGETARLHEKHTYGYDDAGNLTSRQANQLSQVFTPDEVNELESATQSGTVTVAGVVGNGSGTVTVPGGEVYVDKSFAAAGQPLSGNVTLSAGDGAGKTGQRNLTLNLSGAVDLVYDAKGNLLTDGKRSFDYDAENRVVKAELIGQGWTTYGYDGLGRRRWRKEYNAQGAFQSETRYVYDGTQVIQERDGGGVVFANYTRGLDLSGSMRGAKRGRRLLLTCDRSGLTSGHAPQAAC